MILVLDNHDSFTHNLVDYLIRLGADVVIKRPEQMQASDWIFGWQGVLLSPGPGHPDRTWDAALTGCPNSLVQAVNWIAERQIPILGVCLGHQAIGLAFGAQLAADTEPVHGKLFEHFHNSTGVLTGLPSPHRIVRYHSLALDHTSVKAPLKIDGYCLSRHLGAVGQEVVMAISHQNRPIWGIQFHPEATLTSYGLYILANWLEQAGVLKFASKDDLPVWPALANGLEAEAHS